MIKFFRGNSRNRRRHFLLESNQKKQIKSKKNRNRALNFFARILGFKKILKLFKASFLLGILLFLMTGFTIFALLSPYFDLKKILVIRDSPNLEVEKIEENLVDFYGNSLFFLQHREIREKLFSIFPEFREIEISEKWPNSIELKIKISPPRYTVLNVETANFSVLSEDGVVLTQKPNEELPVLKILQHKLPILPREKIFEKEILNKIELAQKFFLELKMPIKETRYLYNAREIHLITKNDTEVWLDAQNSIEEQITKLSLASERIGFYEKLLHHIDLRIPERIFWEEQGFY
jgi:cell division septal protein FtsQ